MGSYTNFEVYMIVAVIYLLLSLLYRLAFKVIGLIVFARRRQLGTAL